MDLFIKICIMMILDVYLLTVLDHFLKVDTESLWVHLITIVINVAFMYIFVAEGV